MQRHATIITGITIVLTLLVVNYVASRHFVRADLTANQEYTLADATKTLLRNLDDVVTMRVYFSKNLPPQLTHVRRGVEDLLQEYRQYGGANFVVDYRDPLADPQTERELMVLGIQPLQVNVVERDKQEVARIYLGLVMMHADKKEVITVDPRQPTQHLEEWLTGGIVKLTRDTLPVIGWWTPAGRGEGEGYEMIRKVVEDRYTVQEIDAVLAATAPTPATHHGLVILSPQQLGDTQLRAIDAYLHAGGQVLMMIDSVRIGPNFAGVKYEHGLQPLLSAYGVTIPTRLVADAVSEYASFRSDYFSYTVPYPFWPAVRGEGFSRSHPAVGQLESLPLPWVSPIEVAAELPKGLTATVLAKSSPLSQETPGEPPFALDPQAAALVVPRAAGTPRNLIVELTGEFPRAFPADAATRDTVDAAPSARGRLVVVGTAQLLEDRMITLPQFAEGVTFFENVIDAMTLGETLVGIRSRPVTARPIMNLDAGEKAMIRYANMLGIPLLIILGGFGGVVWRRRRWQHVREKLAA